MVFVKVNKPVGTTPLTPQEIAQKAATEGLKGVIDKAISASSDDYRVSYKKLLESKGLTKKGISRFQRTEADVASFLDEIYDNLPSIFRKMVDDAVEEQTRINNLKQEQKDELKRELSNVIDQELRLKGKLA